MIAVYVLAPVHIYSAGGLAFYFPRPLGIATAFFWLLSFYDCSLTETNTVSALNVEMETDYTIKTARPVSPVGIPHSPSFCPLSFMGSSDGLLPDARLYYGNLRLSIPRPSSQRQYSIFSIFSITIAHGCCRKLHNELFTAGILCNRNAFLLSFASFLPVPARVQHHDDDPSSQAACTALICCAHQPGSPAFCQIRPGCYHTYSAYRTPPLT